MNPNWLDRLHGLAAQRERIARAALGTRVRAHAQARQAQQTLESWASVRRAELDEQQATSWQQFMSSSIDYSSVVIQHSREAAQALELDGLEQEQAAAVTQVQSTERSRQAAMQAHAATQRRLSALQALTDRQRAQADQRAQLIAEEDQPPPARPWKDQH
jgi:hypothetical protein